jgi:hypothetical protein
MTESLHFRDKNINYIEQEIQRGSMCLEIMKYIKLRSSFLRVSANSTLEGGQSRNRTVVQRAMKLLALLLIRRDIYRVHNRLLLVLTLSHFSSALIPSPKIKNPHVFTNVNEQSLRSSWSVDLLRCV